MFGYLDRNWQKWRLVILSSYSLFVFLALVFIWFKPDRDPFNKVIHEGNWQEIETNTLLDERKSSPGKKLARKSDLLTTEIYWIANSSGETLRHINRYWSLKLGLKDIETYSHNEIGSYGVFVRQDRTYLSTCLHSAGKTAFAPQDFSKLANSDLANRLLPWIFGFEDLRDWDCFWVNISVASQDLTEQQIRQLLEQELLDLVGHLF